MHSYKVASDRIAGKNIGDTITEQELEGVSVAALLEAGHIVGETTKPTKADKE